MRALVGIALVGAVVAGLLLGGVPIVEWLSGLPPGEPAQEHVSSVPEPVPVARSSELTLARARSLQSGGHLHDALRLLEQVDAADPLRGEADRLKADVQGQLLEGIRFADADTGNRP